MKSYKIIVAWVILSSMSVGIILLARLYNYTGVEYIGLYGLLAIGVGLLFLQKHLLTKKELDEIKKSENIIKDSNIGQSQHLEEIKDLIRQNHLLMISQRGSTLRSLAAALKSVAEYTNKPTDIAAADEAARNLADFNMYNEILASEQRLKGSKEEEIKPDKENID